MTLLYTVMNGAMQMAKPILRTPELKGADADRFVSLHSVQTISEKDREMLKSCVETYRKHKK